VRGRSIAASLVLTLAAACEGGGGGGGGNAAAVQAAPSQAPSATLTTGIPTTSPSPAVTASPSPSPAPSPTATEVAQAGSTFTCSDTQFLSDQSRFAAGSISADQFEDICGTVTSVLAPATTSSGTHGYFYIQMPPPSNYQIEIVSNLTAMAEAPSNNPPQTWPWVSVGQYVYVQGRYYYDNSASQGVDWTEDDSSNSWPHIGYVGVCDSTGTTCYKYW
jgi:hypothetical protein